MKTVLLWDPRAPERKPQRFNVNDTLASAMVRAGVAAPADPADYAALSAGGALDPSNLVEVVFEVGFLKQMARAFVPASVAAVGIGLGILAVRGSAQVAPAPTPTPTPGAGPAPVDLGIPGFPRTEGSTTSGSTLTHYAPLYDRTPDFWEAREINGARTVEYMPWTVVTNSFTGSAGAVGETVITQWRATYNGAVSAVSETVPFGPIVGDQAVLAWTFNSDGTGVPAGYFNFSNASNATLSTQTYIAGTQVVNPNFPSLYFGATVGSTFGSSSRTDGRLKTSYRGSTTSLLLTIELPAAGDYDLYTGHGLNSSVTPGFVVRDTSGSPIYTAVGASAVSATQVMDANGVVASEAAWVAASAYGGTPKRLTFATTKAVMLKSASNNMEMFCGALVKVA